MSAVETLPDVDVEALAAEPLPPCELKTLQRRLLGLLGRRSYKPCGKRSVGVARIVCASCGPWPLRAVCSTCVSEIQRDEVQCGRCNRGGLCIRSLS